MVMLVSDLVPFFLLAARNLRPKFEVTSECARLPSILDFVFSTLPRHILLFVPIFFFAQIFLLALLSSWGRKLNKETGQSQWLGRSELGGFTLESLMGERPPSFICVSSSCPWAVPEHLIPSFFTCTPTLQGQRRGGSTQENVSVKFQCLLLSFHRIVNTKP